MSDIMDVGDTDLSTKPPPGRKMKSRAPPPPAAPQPAPRKLFPSPRNVVPDGGGQAGDTKENVSPPTVGLDVTLPGGFQTGVTADGSKALMDLLVDLCSRYHLNPACHTLELLSSEGRPVTYKPNALLGMLDVQYVLIKEKILEGKVIHKPLSKVPEKTIRLVVNFHKNQKAVVRVSPQVPLRNLVPVICDKCDFDPNHVILLKDNISNYEMDLDKSLCELGIRELYVLDQKLESICSDTLSDNNEEKRGLLGFLKFKRRKGKNVSTAPVSPCVEARPNTLGQSQSVMNVSRMSSQAEVKKRRAPPPPQATPTPSAVDSDEGRCNSPNANQQKKRRAPAPPPTPVLGTPVEDSTCHSMESSEVGESVCSSESSLGGPQEEAPSPDTEHADVVPSGVPEETESALNLRIEEAENNRHSVVGAERQVPLKPRRSPTREPPTLTIPPPPPDTPPPTQQDSHDAGLETYAAADSQPRLRSLQDGDSGLAPNQEPDNASVVSSDSLPDQGYVPSEGMAEESFVGLPSEIAHPPSLDRRLEDEDRDSDSDEGCATWGSRHRHSDEISCQRKDSYEEDSKVTMQLQQTLAELEANLADVDNTDRASTSNSSTLDKSFHEVPVSYLDFEVPVTAINEVIDNLEPDVGNCEASPLSRTQNVLIESQIPAYKPHGVVYGALNRTTGSRFLQATLAANLPEERPNGSSAKTEDAEVETAAIPVTEIQDDSHAEPPVLGNLQGAPSAWESAKNPSRNPKSLTTSQPSEETEEAISIKLKTAQNSITPNVSSRYGLKTFTVVPPKPTVTQNSAGSLTTGAIKIDALGNLVTQDSKYRSRVGPESNTAIPRVEKVKAFWTSAEQRDTAPCSGGVVNKTKCPEISKLAPAETSEDVVESTKDVLGEADTKSLLIEAKGHLRKPINEPDQKRDLSFLKPSRRTSSQYVASALARYTGMRTSRSKNVPKSDAEADLSVSRQKLSGTNSFSNGSRSAGVHLSHSTHDEDSENRIKSSVQSNVSQMKEKGSSTSVADPKRSLSFQECNNDKLENARVIQDGSGKFSVSHEERSTATVRTNWKNDESSTIAPIHQCLTATPTGPEHSIPQSVSTSVPAQNAARDCGLAWDRESVSQPSSSAVSGTRQLAVFGPVRKCKPVVLKSVQKEVSLHSTLMEAIQSGDRKDQLRKVSATSRALSPCATENERSALLAAIRAQNHSSRLRKTKSEAANEVESFRKAESEDPAVQSDNPPPPPSHTPPPALVPYVPYTLAATQNSPEGTREALMDAIRSGSAAQRLKKVPVPTKTVLVNGRLGKMQASSSILQEH